MSKTGKFELVLLVSNFSCPAVVVLMRSVQGATSPTSLSTAARYFSRVWPRWLISVQNPPITTRSEPGSGMIFDTHLYSASLLGVRVLLSLRWRLGAHR